MLNEWKKLSFFFFLILEEPSEEVWGTSADKDWPSGLQQKLSTWSAHTVCNGYPTTKKLRMAELEYQGKVLS
jgi:hypothetical protein